MENFNFNIVNSKNIQSDCIQTKKFSISINSKTLFQDSELSLSLNNIYGLIGKNGAGKTTLINHISQRNSNRNRFKSC